jgi:hypothetical protein
MGLRRYFRLHEFIAGKCMLRKMNKYKKLVHGPLMNVLPKIALTLPTWVYATLFVVTEQKIHKRESGY